MFHRDIVKMKKEISLYYSNKQGVQDATYVVDHSIPLGCFSVTLIFAVFTVHDETSFVALSRRDRHHLWAVVAQHECEFNWVAFRTLHFSVVYLDIFRVYGNGRL